MLARQGRLAVTEQELVSWGQRLGQAAAVGLTIAISGELGAGKTTLVRAICLGYGVRDEVTSPSFALIHEYQSARSPVFHLDLFRLRGADELTNLGWDELFDGEALVLVEWPERAAGRLPAGHVTIELEHVSGDPTRRILFAGGHP
ncbi:MAG TPA: tRNA (adenosine(37)-N6)-threonylcarbamoyltransferase complex ATPase subunit type 1 TsaE [Gemmatimonadaceae bacterium]|nr:tRNA (adenosine(37)-N6)-threonylcarbamoyltransferase complex ATPase subunit type 1 TsaE [Gemmatimonadaceae bacterium]